MCTFLYIYCAADTLPPWGSSSISPISDKTIILSSNLAFFVPWVNTSLYPFWVWYYYRLFVPWLIRGAISRFGHHTQQTWNPLIKNRKQGCGWGVRERVGWSRPCSLVHFQTSTLTRTLTCHIVYILEINSVVRTFLRCFPFLLLGYDGSIGDNLGNLGVRWMIE